MCNFFRIESEKVAAKSVIGYKVAVKSNGKYYSPITGIEYAADRKVKIPKVYGKKTVRDDLGICDVLRKGNNAHDKYYKGLTAVFTNKSCGEIKLADWKTRLMTRLYAGGTPVHLVLLEMELSGELYNGDYSNMEVYLGSFIKSFKEI
jgi:hypothetical protein